MATLGQVLVAQAGVPAQFEAKYGVPKVSTVLIKVAGMLPTGPNLPFPGMATRAPIVPLPTLPAIFKGPSSTTNGEAGLPLAPRTPGAPRGSIDYGSLADAPMTPGAQRGTILYGG